MLSWAIHRVGSVEAWLRHDIETLLRPWRTESVNQSVRQRRKTKARN